MIRRVLELMRQLSDRLGALQHDDGTYDIGNLHSPPDTAFLIQDLCQVWELLEADDQPVTVPIRSVMHGILQKAGPALAEGGVHTPNHRWEVSAALARVNHIFPDKRYVDRIDEWLAEGIDAAPDGIYSERSAIYAAAVSNPSLLTIAWLLDRPELIEFVRRNLEATLHLLEPDGEVDVVASRRQDQFQIGVVWGYLLQFRELALLDGDGRFAAVAQEHRTSGCPCFGRLPGRSARASGAGGRAAAGDRTADRLRPGVPVPGVGRGSGGGVARRPSSEARTSTTYR